MTQVLATVVSISDIHDTEPDNIMIIILLFFPAKKPTLALLTFINGFKLVERAAPKWEIVASNLRLDNIGNIKSDKHSSETDKVEQVFTEWLNNAPQLNGGKYPKTWKGLEDLLNDSELAQVREEFFNAL